ncbi:hypothetical protein E2C01_023432 [Portunus trituberculatus]|uniref:Uncharacterized protein n=2 Tax=Portunus trituberculatus TaxID=210409 RepID=A0A5B7EB47_PORTR|nr:hypothetical protein [Portunus trituberculatus]
MKDKEANVKGERKESVRRCSQGAASPVGVGATMGEGNNRGQVTFDESHVNIKLPNRCRRCHAYNEDPEAPSLRESFVILLRQMTRSPGDGCFVFTLALPCLGVTAVCLLLLLLAGYTTVSGAMLHCTLLLLLAWLCVVHYFGRRYARLYSTEHDILLLEAV